MTLYIHNFCFQVAAYLTQLISGLQNTHGLSFCPRDPPIMSVKFEKETIKDSPLPGLGGRKHEFAHEIGERLTGGETTQGYLAVSYMLPQFHYGKTDNHHASGLSPAAPNQPTSHEDAHIWLPRGSTRAHSFMGCKRCRSIRPLPQLSSAQDGSVWRFHQRAARPLPDQHTAEDVLWEDELDRKDYADPCQQSCRMSAPTDFAP